MPEGDTIYRTAVRLRAVLEGRRIETARGREAALAAESLSGTEVASIEARGKHLLIHLGDGRALHTHLGMHGAWHIYQPGEPWRKPERRAGIVLETGGTVAVCFNPKTLELLTPDRLRRHEHLRRLGPDLLARRFDAPEALRRFRVHNPTPIGEALMNQSIVCGIGNVYKSEILFLSRIDPFVPIASLPDEGILALMEKARDLMSRNLEGYPRRTRFSCDRSRHWVYGRSGKPCLVCGGTIRIRRQGDQGRTTFWCPTCQGGLEGVGE